MTRKTKEEKAEERMQGFLEADQMEWENIIANRGLMKAVCELQSKYGLPLPMMDLMGWMGWEEPIEIDPDTDKVIFGERGQRREKPAHDIEKIAKDFSVPDKWASSLHGMVTTGQKGPDHMGAGFPYVRIAKENGQLKHEIIITDETDLGNPLVHSCHPSTHRGRIRNGFIYFQFAHNGGDSELKTSQLMHNLLSTML